MGLPKRKKGFTLVELIIVIAIIAVLAGAIFVAVDPAKRFHQSRNARRATDVQAILSAIIQYATDNDGTHYSEVVDMFDDDYYQIGTAATGCDSGCTAQTTQVPCVDLTDIGSNFLATIPMDPSTGTEEKTDYYIMKDSNGAITVGACDPEGEDAGGGGTPPVIKVTR